MKYTKEQRLDIGKEVATHKMKAKDAAALYGVSIPTISIWAKDYKIQNGIYHKNANSEISNLTLDKIKNMSKEELTDELIKSLINQERLKKGYMVKGGGQEKEYITIFNKNSK